MWRAGSRSTRRRSAVLEGSAWVGCGCTSVIRSPGAGERSGDPGDPKRLSLEMVLNPGQREQFVTLAVKRGPVSGARPQDELESDGWHVRGLVSPPPRSVLPPRQPVCPCSG